MSSARDFDRHLHAELVIPSDTGEARQIQDTIEQLLRDRRVPDRDIFSIRLALEEALVNAIKHGNQMDRSKNVRITYELLPDSLELCISDEGEGFDPADVPDPIAAENLERPSGRGLMLMRYYMNEVIYNERGNVVRMRKHFRANGQGS